MSFFVTLAAFLQSGSEKAVPVRERLQAAYIAVEALEYCSERSQPAAEHFQTHGYDRQFKLENRAWGLFGRDADYVHDYASLPRPKKPSCSIAAVRHLAEKIDSDWDVANQLMANTETQVNRGLWLGLFPLCRDNVLAAQVLADEHNVDEFRVQVSLNDEGAGQLLHYSERFVPSPGLRKPMSLRLDGAVILSPTMYEPVASLDVGSLSHDTANAVVSATRSKCSALP